MSRGVILYQSKYVANKKYSDCLKAVAKQNSDKYVAKTLMCAVG